MSPSYSPRPGERVRVKGGGQVAATGTVLLVDPMTYLCQVSWDSPHGGSQSVVHRMYLEPASEVSMLAEGWQADPDWLGA